MFYWSFIVVNTHQSCRTLHLPNKNSLYYAIKLSQTDKLTHNIKQKCLFYSISYVISISYCTLCFESLFFFSESTKGSCASVPSICNFADQVIFAHDICKSSIYQTKLFMHGNCLHFFKRDQVNIFVFPVLQDGSSGRISMSSTSILTLTFNKIPKDGPRNQNNIFKKMLKEDGTILTFERNVLERLRTDCGNLYI